VCDSPTGSGDLVKRRSTTRASVWLVACAAVVLTALGALMSSCGSESTPASDKVYELRLSHHIPPNAPPAKAIEAWTKRVQEATGGRVHFTVYPSETLAKGREALQATEQGVCDVAMINLAFVGEQWGLNSVVTLGSVAMPSERGTEIWDRLIDKFPEMAREMSSVKILGKSVATSTSLHTQGVEIHVPADLKELKIAALGDSTALVQAAGAISVNVSSADWATAASKGLIVGCMAPVYVVTDRGLEKVFDHHLDLGMGANASALVMNWEVWNSLPPDIQAALDGLTPWLDAAMRAAATEVEAQGWQKCPAQSVVEPTAQESALWKACFQPVAQQWIEDNAGKGRSQEIYDYLTQLTEE
jgi:TRAP-type C4-dicarboxylate transport system substrate-binding protein